MIQIKTFVRTAIGDDNDEIINEFIRTHNVKRIKTNVVQGFTYLFSIDYVKHVDNTVRPSIVTTIIYEVEK